jgi:hypothetical protein
MSIPISQVSGLIEAWLMPYREGEPRRMHVNSILVDAPDLRRVVAAWENVPLNWTGPTDDPGAAPRDLAERWEWLWSHVEYDSNLLAMRAQVGRRRLEELVDALRGNMIVYPAAAGARSTTVATAVLQQTLASVGQKRRAAKKRPNGTGT